jgi:hypothetical protein
MSLPLSSCFSDFNVDHQDLSGIQRRSVGMSPITPVRPKTPVQIVIRASATTRLAIYGDFQAEGARGFLMGHIRPYGKI